MRQTWMKRALVAGAATVLAGVMALPAGAVPSHWVIDQHNERVGPSGSTILFACTQPNAGIFQEITPGVAEWVGFSVVFQYGLSEDGSPPVGEGDEITMNLRADSITGPLLASATAVLPPADPGSSPPVAEVDFQLDAPLSVPVGGTVVLQLPLDQRIQWLRNQTDTYAGGRSGLYCNGDPEFRDDDEDLLFTTYEAGPITDSDGDGLDDDRDPDTVGDAVAALPDSAFHAPGHRRAIESQLESAEADIVAGDIAEARTKLEHLRRHVDGCETGTGPDGNDWIVDCAAQGDIRALIDTLLTHV